MAYGLSKINQNGVDYRINDPNITDEFSTSTAYTVGEYVNYNGLLYRFEVAHPAGAWNTNHVTEVRVGGEITDLKSAFDNVLKITESVDLSTATTITGLINSSSKWTNTSGYKSYKFGISSNDVISVRIIAGEYKVVLGFLTNDTLVSGQTPSFCSGTGRIAIESGNTEELAIPTDCNYLIVNKESTTTSYNPESIAFYKYKTIVGVDASLTVEGNAADAKETGDRIDNLKTDLYESFEGEKKFI